MPIYGTQWHPEKAAWEWDTRLRLSHVEHVRPPSHEGGRSARVPIIGCPCYDQMVVECDVDLCTGGMFQYSSSHLYAAPFHHCFPRRHSEYFPGIGLVSPSFSKIEANTSNLNPNNHRLRTHIHPNNHTNPTRLGPVLKLELTQPVLRERCTLTLGPVVCLRCRRWSSRRTWAATLSTSASTTTTRSPLPRQRPVRSSTTGCRCQRGQSQG